MNELASKEFYVARRCNPYHNVQDPSLTNRPFWTRQQVFIYHDVLKEKKNLYVPHVKSIDMDHLQKNATYFGDALSLCEKLGIINLMQFSKGRFLCYSPSWIR